jgi:MFS family permease
VTIVPDRLAALFGGRGSVDRRAELTPTIRRLLAVRLLRSIAQGALAVDFALYLDALGWSATEIGLVLTGGGVALTAFGLGVGPLSDRLGRRRLLVGYQALTVVTALVGLLTAAPLLLVPAAILGGFGRGSNGTAGAFAPAEQAWLAETAPPVARTWIYGLNSGLGFFGMGVGAFIGILPPFLEPWLPGPLAYRPLFAVAVVIAIAGGLILAGTKEQYRPSVQRREVDPGQPIRTAENHVLRRLIAINAFQGVSIGLTGPLISYWFAVRFGLGPESIAPVFGATFLLTGVAALIGGRLAEASGAIRAVVVGRLAGTACLVGIALAPTFPLAALAFLGRSCFSRGTAGPRQAMVVGLVREERRGMAISLNNGSIQLPQSLGPSVAGALIEGGLLDLPFYLGGALQFIYLVLYARLLRPFEPPRRTAATVDAIAAAEEAEDLDA